MGKLDKLKKKKDLYRAAKKDFDMEIICNSISYDLTEKTLATKKDICDLATPPPQVSGVYFLIMEYKYESEIMYVGQSVNVFARLACHMTDQAKTFNKFAYVSCHPDQLDILESLYILHLHPKLNSKAGASKDGQYLTPIKHSDLMQIHKRLLTEADKDRKECEAKINGH